MALPIRLIAGLSAFGPPEPVNVSPMKLSVAHRCPCGTPVTPTPGASRRLGN
jgi:hypothetical protein